MSAPSNELPVLGGMRGSHISEPARNREDEIRLFLMGVAALFSYLGFWRGFIPIDVVAIGATLIGGYPVFIETFHSLRQRSINMEVSMTVAIVVSPGGPVYGRGRGNFLRSALRIHRSLRC